MKNKKNWCIYFDSRCEKTKKMDTLGECNHECKTCANRQEKPSYAFA